jgi:hypothetical protein
MASSYDTGRGTAIRWVIERLAGRCGGGDLVEFDVIATAPGDPRVLVADMTKVGRMPDHDRSRT